ncbi:unnamed protein product [Urochloa decumbens]|uniref:KIB1-4 beta-propeller domain-containing protein n=1 Tax=Urochloa decumbens TaxID=240449 RepID=A0ABC8YT60_9POAL
METVEEGSAVDWTRLPANVLRSVSGRLADPQDFVSFRAACPAWRLAVPEDAHRRFFHPWIVESSDPDDDSGNVLFYSPSSGEYHVIHVAALEGKRVAGHGAGLLLGIDTADELSAVLVNPLTGESATAPRLPERFRGTPVYGFAATDDPAGEGEVVAVVYNRPAGGQARGCVALWRRRRDAGAGWATVPAQAFWMRMPQLRARLVAHGPQVVEAEEAAIAAVNGHAHGHVEWFPGMRGAHVVEHGGQARVLVRMELEQPPAIAGGGGVPVKPGDTVPGASFELRNTVDPEGDAVDWASAPELHGKVILQSEDSICHVLPASVGLSGNSVYFLSWQRQEVVVDEDGGVGDGEPFGYFLCRWDVIKGVATVVEKVPGAWDRQKPGRWFLPTFKY